MASKLAMALAHRRGLVHAILPSFFLDPDNCKKWNNVQ